MTETLVTEPAADALPFSLTRPIHIADVALKARDVPKLAEYYRDLLGLETIAAVDGRIDLGAGGVRLLSLEPLPPGALGDDPRSAGLFHTAFLMPSRPDLGRWIHHVAERQFPVDGMSDHLVSEAIYLNDPEGNGIEVYADRPHATWPMDGSRIRMSTDPIDLQSIVESAGATSWAGAPEMLRIGHVHLRVGNPGAASAWWRSDVGLDLMVTMPGAAFLASGGYHHHIGANSWRSANAGPRQAGRSGLAYLTLAGSGIAKERELVDPWGTIVRMRPAA